MIPSKENADISNGAVAALTLGNSLPLMSLNDSGASPRKRTPLRPTMLPLLGRCLRSTAQSPCILRSASLRPPILPSRPLISQQLRFKGMVTKRKKRKGKPVEKERDRRERLKVKVQKELERKRKKIEEKRIARKAVFRLPPHEERPDAVPLGTALAVLRGWQAKAGIFVRGTAYKWAGETKVVAVVRVAKNSNQPRKLQGKVQFPFPVVLGEGTQRSSGRGGKVVKKEEKKRRRMVILDESESVEDAENAGMMVGRKADLDQVPITPCRAKAIASCVGWVLIADCYNGPRRQASCL